MKNNLHEKYIHCLEYMAFNGDLGLEFFGEYNQTVNFYERKNDKNLRTAGVNFTEKGANHFYNPDFLNSLNQKAINFLMIHETFHLLFNHPRRARNGGFDPELSNIAMDMIINQLIVKSIKSSFIDIPKDKDGRNTALFLPIECEEVWVFEVIYEWLKLKKEESSKRRRKKKDEKIFGELFCIKNRPFDAEVTSNYNGSYSTFLDILIEKSKTECDDYIDNFVRRCLVSFKNSKEVKLFGHTDSVIPTSHASEVDYNQKLSLRRAELFKNAIIQRVDNIMNTYAYCISIFEHESEMLSDNDKMKFVLNYEEIQNEVLKKQRIKEINELTTKDHNELNLLFETYRFTELYKFDPNTLKNICLQKGLTLPDIQQEKLKWVQLAQNLLIVEGLADTKKIIINDDNDDNSVIRNDISHLPQYKYLSHITDPEMKKGINRRVTYKFDENGGAKSGLGGGNSSESENQNNRGGYGNNCHNGQEGYDLDSIFENAENNSGEFLDQHIPDTIPEELREQIIRDAKERIMHNLKRRGLETAHIETILEGLTKKRKDYLKEIKRGISQIKGVLKERTIKKPSRRNILGVKGNKKTGSILNVILDTSGSMGGYEEKALSYVFRSDIEINLIQIDTVVKCSEKIKSMKELQKVKIRGGGGTCINPSIEYVKENFPNFNTLILTDGATDSLDFTGYKGKVLIISNDIECPITASNGKVKQIIIKDFND